MSIDHNHPKIISGSASVGLPEVGFVRLPLILTLIPVSNSSWWNGVRDGRYPPPIKLGPRTTAWRVEDIRALIESLGEAR